MKSLILLPVFLCVALAFGIGQPPTQHPMRFTNGNQADGKVLEKRDIQFDTDATILSVGRNKRSAAWRINLWDYGDWMYNGVIQVGNPPVSIMVLIDTGSGGTWVNGAGCQPSCRDQPFYDPKKSSTARNNSKGWYQAYGGGYVNGYEVRDTITIGGVGQPNIPIENFTVGVITNTTFGGSTYAGILGLEISDWNPIQEAIRRGYFNNPIISIFFRRFPNSRNATGGSITFGQVETDYCKPVIGWYPITSWRWQLGVSKIAVGSWSNTTTVSALLDTGTTFIYGPTNQVEQIQAQFKNKTYYDGNLWVVPCNNFTGPTLDFTIGGHVYSVQAPNYLIDRYGNGVECMLGIGKADYGSQFQWVLGTPFLRQFCTSYNYQTQQIGLAESYWYL
ncbi:unnamed protein product, partial [Mesorhabditis spiculigera]